jgi:hypothetical protein
VKTLAFSLLLTCLAATKIFAEWRTETFTLKAGWNAIYPNVDATHATLDDLLATYPDVREIWRWQPERVDPRLPRDVTVSPVGLEWQVWKRGMPADTTFDRLDANFGYLIRLSDTALTQTVAIKGRAALPEVRWRGDGLHLAGFPVISTGTRPTFAAYLAPTGFPLGSTDMLRYNGGPILSGSNPVPLNPTSSRIERGQAYWIRVEKFSRYYGPLKVEMDAGSRVAFGTRSDEAKLLLTNQTSGNLTLTLAAQASESAPDGLPAVAGTVPLKVQVDAETAWTSLTSRTITLAAGVIMPVRLTLDRPLLAGPPGSHFASLLRLTTTAGVAGQEMFLPVTADKGSLAGLWIGEAQISQVGSVALRYERDAAGNTVYETSGPNIGKPRVIEDLTTPGGATTLPSVNRTYPLRLIVHVNNAGQAVLLSHVYQGKLAGAAPDAPLGLVRTESLLDAAELKSAVRLSVAHLPLDTALAFSGAFAAGGTLSNAAPLTTAYNAAENPFVHSYHPDHDNRDSRFQTLLPTGKESFDIRRRFTLTIDAVAPQGAASSWGNTLISGTYAEVIEGPYKSPLRVQGPFALYKVSDTPTILPAPAYP